MLPNLVALLAAASTFTPIVSHSLPSPGTGQVALEQGTLSAPLAGELSQSVLAWATANKARYGLPAWSTLRFGHAFGTKLGASFHYYQQVRGVDVYGAKLVVTLDKQKRVIQVGSSLVTADRVLDAWQVNERDARTLAGAPIPFALVDGAGVPEALVKRVIFGVSDEAHAGYLIHVSSLDRLANWYVGLDAVTGQKLFVQNRVHHGATTANAYPVSPGGLDAGVGATPTGSVELLHPDGGPMMVPTDGGTLTGTQIDATNCCVNEGCDPDAGMKRVDGGAMFQGINVPYLTVLCDRLQRASNVTNPSGSYEYTPVDPPTNKTAVVQSDLANSDEFAEVHAFFHVNRVYDWMRSISSTAQGTFAGQVTVEAFKMRDERRTPPKKPVIWTNAMFPNFNEILSNPGCLFAPPCRINTLTRMDNAAFMPVENFAQIPIDAFNTGADTLMIFQGNAADAAYDSTVIQHEFGHGAVYATAEIGFDTIALDNRSANNEAGALHEGFADYIAGAFNNLADIGPYFGPRAAAGAGVPGVAQDGYLRSLDNTKTCPDVLWGEVHQDSEHVSAALWKARQTVFQGTNGGRTFDEAFYAMLVSIPPTADFAITAASMGNMVRIAFPGIATAQAQMQTIFDDKGVTNCSKVLTVTGTSAPRTYFGIAQADQALSQTLIPGPFQFKLAFNGPVTVRVQAQMQAGGFGGAPPPVTVLARRDEPLLFVRQGAQLIDNAHKTQEFTAANGMFDSNLEVCTPGADVHVALAARGGGATLQNVRVTVGPSTTCVVDAGVDAGTPDAGTTETRELPAVGPGSTLSGTPPPGCGCGAAGGAVPLLGVMLLGFFRRRRQN